MKKLVLFLGAVLTVAAAAATSQTITATVNVVDLVTSPLINVTKASVNMVGPIVAGDVVSLATSQLSVKGTAAKPTTVYFPKSLTVAETGGSSITSAITVANAGTGGAIDATDTVNWKYKVADPSTPFTVDIGSKVTLIGNETPGTYTGELTLTAAYD